MLQLIGAFASLSKLSWNSVPLQIDSCLRAYLGPAEYAAVEAGDVACPCQDAGASQIDKGRDAQDERRILSLQCLPWLWRVLFQCASTQSTQACKARKAAGQAAQRAKAEAEREQQEAR